MFLTSAWSGSPTIVDNAILMKFSQCDKRPFPVKSFPKSMRTGVQL